jgi:hypothetical protein
MAGGSQTFIQTTNASGTSINPATEEKQDTGNTALSAIETAVEIIDNAISGNEMQVDVVSSALPTGAATESTLNDVYSECSDINGFVNTIAGDTTSIDAKLTDGTQKTQIVASDTPIIDAFGRIRVSNPETLHDSKQIFDDSDLDSSVENQPLFYDNQETSGADTTTDFQINKAQTVLGVADSTAGTRVRQTKRRFNYQPGKSMMVLMTFAYCCAAQSGVTRREGIFDEKNGLFFEDNGTNYGFVRRTYVTGRIRVVKGDPTIILSYHPTILQITDN